MQRKVTQLMAGQTEIKHHVLEVKQSAAQIQAGLADLKTVFHAGIKQVA